MQHDEVDLAAFTAAHANGAVVIDVREQYEYTAGHIPGARLIPLDQLPHHAGEFQHAETVYVVCATGNRSLAAARYLSRRGIPAYSVAGGTAAWHRSGQSLVRGPHTDPSGHPRGRS